LKRQAECVHRLSVLVFCALLLSACAARQGQSLATRFITPGKPAVDFGGPPVATSDLLQDQMKKVRHLTAQPQAHTSTFGATVEASDTRLAAALLVEAVLPTAASHVRVGREYARLGILDLAYARFNRALLKKPRMSQAQEGLARIWRDWGLPGWGLGSAYRAVYYDPASASARNTLGTILDGLGQFDDARAAYSKAVTLDPNAGWALNNLCNLEFRLGRLEEARAHCDSALLADPSLKAARNNLALTYAAAGDLGRARTEFLAAGDVAAAEYNMGIVRLAEGDYASAALAFEQAIKARPTFTAAKDRAHAAKLRMLAGKP
jgi:tetratricopeptide (TPR) repeat protein